MKLFMTFYFLTIWIVASQSKPAVEIKQQQLIKLPQLNKETPKDEFEDKQRAETRRILDEIDKINQALGYTRRTFPISSKIISNEGYFYPRTTYAPVFLRSGNSNDGRQLSEFIEKHTIELIPNPFKEQHFYYPTPYLQVPLREQFREFQNQQPLENKDDEKYVYRTLPKELLEQSSEKIIETTTFQDENIETTTLMEELSSTDISLKKKSKKSKKDDSDDSNISLVADIVNIMTTDDIEELAEAIDEVSAPSTTILPQLHNDKYMMVDTVIRKEHLKKARKDTLIDDQVERIKTLLATRPTIPTTDKTTTRIPNKNKIPVSSVKPVKKIAKDDENESLRLPSIGGFFPGNQVAKEGIKEGGIVIQRLKVRKGGIAIAGPGGVATAGSGGTAIVGPGGLALTHPRGLTIAGPGAKVYSVPESTDLQSLALRSSARQMPLEGILVATGPIVFYNP